MTGDYGLATHTHASVNDELFALFQPHLSRFEGRQEVGIADYGCADGRNAQGSLHQLLAVLHGRLGVGRAAVCFNDLLPENGERVRALLQRGTGSIIDAFPRTTWTFRPGSFYEPCVAEGAVDLGFTVNAMHWQHRVPAAERNEARFAAVARRELRTFLTRRSEELRPGGLLVLANSTLGPRGRLHPIPGSMRTVLDEMHAEGIVSDQERAELYFPMYMRSPSEFTEPFDRSAAGVAFGLRVVRSYVRTFPCRYVAEYRRSAGTAEDRRRFAEGLARSRRAWSHSTICGVLGEARAELLHRRYRERLLEVDPTGEGSDFTIHFMLLEKVGPGPRGREGAAVEATRARRAWRRLPVELQAQYPAPSLRLDRAAIDGDRAVVQLRVVGADTTRDVVRAQLGSIGVQAASQVCLAAGHLCNDVRRKLDETFLRSIALHSRAPREHELDALLEGRPLRVELRARLLRAHVSRSNPDLVRKLYAFDFDLEQGLAMGTMVLHFSLPRPEGGDPLRPASVRRTFVADELNAVQSPYLARHEAIGRDRIELVEVEHDPNGLRARVRMPAPYTSATDDGGFHVSAVVADAIAHKLGWLHGVTSPGARPLHRERIETQFDAPLRDPEEIEVELTRLTRGPDQAQWGYRLGSGGGRGHGVLTLRTGG